MQKLNQLVTAILLLIVLSTVMTGQSRSVRISSGAANSIDTYLRKLANVGFSGSVIIADQGKPVISRGYGFADEERKLRNSPKTIFDIGSVTKQFTAAAIMKLEMQGKLSTQDKLSKYFQNLPADKADITIHQLLRHSSGLAGGVGGDFEKISETEFLEKVFASPLRFPAGTRFSYSNMGYSLLALIIEKASGESYESYLYSNLFKPAGMESTGYSRPRNQKDRIAIGYTGAQRWGSPVEKAWDGEAPYLHLKGNGGILSTAEDLLKWDRALAGEAILSTAAKKKLYFPTLRDDEVGSRSHYGYGWDVFKTHRGTTRIWHNGTNRVFFADFYRFIDEDVTIILLANRWQSRFGDMGRMIAQTIFDRNHTLPIPVMDNPQNRAFTERMIEVALTEGLESAVGKFRDRTKGTELFEPLIEAKGYELIDAKKPKQAIDVFRLWSLTFPRSAKAFDSLGEAYLEAGDRPKAIENYRKSLALDPDNGYASSVLKRLEGN